MNLLLLEDDDLDPVAEGAGAAPRARVGGERLRHVRKVLRASVGDSLDVGRVGGCIGRGRIVALDRERLVLELGALDRPPPPPLPVTLVLALPRPKFVGRILQAAAAMGVKRILFVHTARVEKSYWQSSVMRPASLRRHLMLGLAQARDTVLPKIDCFPGRRDLAEALPGLVREHGRTIVADAAAALPCPIGDGGGPGDTGDGGGPGYTGDGGGPTALLVGPEGGFLDEELASFKRAGVHAVSLGPRALRVEHAVVALLSRLGA